MLTRRILLSLAATAATLPLAAPARADATEQASKFIAELGRELSGIVNGPAPLKERQAALQKVVDANVDLDDVARFCLGRYWRSATPQQQQEYVEIFRRVLQQNVTGKIGDYQGVTFAVNRAAPRDDNVVVTSTVTRPNNEPNRVDWLVSMASGAPKIIDVIAEGTSLRLTQRSDYASFLARNNNNVQALIDAMRHQAANPSS